MDKSLSADSAKRIMELENKISQLSEKNFFLESELGAVKEAKDKYQLIADFAQDWELWIDPKANFVWISPSCNDLTGYTADEFFKNPALFYELILQEDEQKVRHCMHDSIIFMQIGQTIEFRILTKTKQLRWCEMNSRAVFDIRGNYLGQRSSIRDVTRLKAALGHIRDITENHAREVKQKQKYREEIAGKERELVASIIRIAQKNELVSYLRKNLMVIRATLPGPMQPKVAVMLEKIEEHQRMQLFNWEDFKFHFEKVHNGFFSRLAEKFKDLTVKDQRMCAYLLLGLSTKEIAGLVNITAESAEIGRIRLRKKLGLARNQNLTIYLQSL